MIPLTTYHSVLDLKNKIGEKNNFIFAEQGTTHTNVVNEVVGRKAVE